MQREQRDAFLDSVITVIKASNAGMLSRVAVLEAELKELRSREPIVGPQGPPGDRGEKGADGEPGRDGADSVVPGPAGPMGERGEKGLDGIDGKDGRDGQPGRDGIQGIQGEKGLDGRDGLQGRDGKDGVNGQDGTLETLGVKFADYRALQFYRKDSGDVVGTVSLEGLPRFCDVFKHDVEYHPGDIVKWGGSTWIAKNTGVGLVPGDRGLSDSMWALFSERGRQGKTGDRGPEGAPGQRGERGDRGPERW